MKITIIGWYGTETIGDRAILTGIFSFFNQLFNKIEIKLGSLYPFFSKRTLNEDYSFYKDIKIDIFNSKKSKDLDVAIRYSDLVVMGGGPLMDLNELFMVEYAFKKAKKLGIKTALLGCGVGPLFYKKYRKSVLEISQNSDLIILRDSKSKDNLIEVADEFNKSINIDKIYTSFDPSVKCAIEYNKQNCKEEKDYIAINLREFPLEYNKNKHSKNINYELKKFIGLLSENFSNRVIKLIPMHYFHVGGDDRTFLNSIALELTKENIIVQNSNLSLEQTMDVYQNAYFNVGMRFHSVVFQTILSGKNYVLDYTEPQKGKIFGFLKDVDKQGFFKDRYISLQAEDISFNIIQNMDDKFIFEESELEEKLNVYIEKLKDLQI